MERTEVDRTTIGPGGASYAMDRMEERERVTTTVVVTQRGAIVVSRAF